MENYGDVFEGVGRFTQELHLTLRDDAVAHKAATREIPLSLKESLIAEVQDLLHQGIIEKVSEPTDLVNAPMIVRKPTAKHGIRLCIDSRPMNKALKRAEYQIPTID